MKDAKASSEEPHGESTDGLDLPEIKTPQQRARTEEQTKKVLRDRAIKLAQEAEAEKTTEESMEVVEFLLAHERYGIESCHVREIYPLKEITPVPCTPPFVLGIINVRGQVLSVIDIKKFFDLPEKGLTNHNKVIILQNDKMEFGILADVVVGVKSLRLSELQSDLPTLTGIRAEYLKGLTEERVVILDAEKLLSAENIIVHEEVPV